MRLAKLRLQNFRCFQGEFTVSFEDLTAIIGRNDVGKSAIMDALAIFFEESKLDKDDASVNGDRKAVKIGTSPKILLKATAQHGGEFHTGPRGIRRVYRSDLDRLRIALARWRQLPVNGKDLALHFASKPFPAGDLAGDLPPDLRLPVSYLKDRNGISTSAFDNLISSGVFNRFDGPEVPKEKGVRISAYAQFEEALVNMSARTQSSCERQGIPMLDALKRGLVHCGCTLADLLTAVFDGKVRICGIADASVGLARLRLDAGDVDRAVEYFRQRYREG